MAALVVMAVSSVYLNLGPELFVPAVDLLTAPLPGDWDRRAAEALVEAQHPLHTGEAFGTAGRVLVSLAGLGLAAISTAALVTACRPLTAPRPPGSRPSRDRSPRR